MSLTALTHKSSSRKRTKKIVKDYLAEIADPIQLTEERIRIQARGFKYIRRLPINVGKLNTWFDSLLHRREADGHIHVVVWPSNVSWLRQIQSRSLITYL